ncbi:MAG: Gfo/Idh/MocA family oxidoreductase [Thiolinea sp.]
MARNDVDAIMIASPDETHAGLCLAAMQAGKPVLCEKPLAPTPEECLKLIEVEVGMGRRMLQLGFMRRFDPSYTEMKAAGSDLLGNATDAAPSTAMCQPRPASPGRYDYQFRTSWNMMWRVLRMLDGEFTSVRCSSRSVDTRQNRCTGVHGAETTTGQLVNIEINNNAAYAYDVRAELVGEKGSVFLNAPIHTRMNIGLQAYERYDADWRQRFAEAYRRRTRPGCIL